MGTTADKLEYLSGTKAAIKQAIINKGVAVPDGTTFRAYADKIADIIDVPDLSNPGAAGDLRSGKQLVGADGGIITGTLAEVTQATPSISVSSGGLITASATQSGGIVEGGSKSSTQQLTTQGAKTVTPGTTAQTAVASGRYTTGDVVVAGDANLVPENIAEGVSIFGVTGTHSGGGGTTFTKPYLMAESLYLFYNVTSSTENIGIAQIFGFCVAAAPLIAVSNYAWVERPITLTTTTIAISANSASSVRNAIQIIQALTQPYDTFDELSAATKNEIRQRIKSIFSECGFTLQYSDNSAAVSSNNESITINF